MTRRGVIGAVTVRRAARGPGTWPAGVRRRIARRSRSSRIAMTYLRLVPVASRSAAGVSGAARRARAAVAVELAVGRRRRRPGRARGRRSGRSARARGSRRPGTRPRGRPRRGAAGRRPRGRRRGGPSRPSGPDRVPRRDVVSGRRDAGPVTDQAAVGDEPVDEVRGGSRRCASARSSPGVGAPGRPRPGRRSAARCRRRHRPTATGSSRRRSRRCRATIRTGAATPPVGSSTPWRSRRASA